MTIPRSLVLIVHDSFYLMIFLVNTSKPVNNSVKVELSG
jgi:hypothetical protein